MCTGAEGEEEPFSKILEQKLELGVTRDSVFPFPSQLSSFPPHVDKFELLAPTRQLPTALPEAAA